MCRQALRTDRFESGDAEGASNRIKAASSGHLHLIPTFSAIDHRS